MRSGLISQRDMKENGKRLSFSLFIGCFIFFIQCISALIVITHVSSYGPLIRRTKSATNVIRKTNEQRRSAAVLSAKHASSLIDLQ